MVFQHPNRSVNILTAMYFAVAIIEVIAELFSYDPLIFVLKPLMPFLLIVLYFQTSKRRLPLYFIAMFFSIVTNLLFIPDTTSMLFMGVIAFTFHRIAAIWLVLNLLKPTDYIPIVIATIPFLLIFFYLLAISTEIPADTYLILVVQNFLIAFFGGIALSNYIMNDNKKNSWLLISGLLFVSLQFIIFLEKYYLSDVSLGIFRPIAMGLNTFAFYTFYEFVVATERSDNNGAPA